MQPLVMEKGLQLALGLDALQTHRDDMPLGHVSDRLQRRRFLEEREAVLGSL